MNPEAALRAAYEEGFEPPFAPADIRKFITSPTDPPPGPARDAALAALKEADAEAERRNLDAMLRVLRAAAGR